MLCPITGQTCDHDKSIQFTQIIQGEKNEGVVCTECPAMKGIGLFGSFGNLIPIQEADVPEAPPGFVALPMASFQPGINPVIDLFQKLFGNSYPPNAMHQGIACSGCGATLGQVRQAGRLGCPKCYESFEQYLQPVLERSHEGNLVHVGKRPKNIPTFQHHNIEDLKIKLGDAIKDERFEDAAVLRDAIKRLEEHVKKEDLSDQQDQNPKNLDS
jgi:protein arginine kinase activator